MSSLKVERLRRCDRVVDGGGLENHCEGNLTVGSNPTTSANHPERCSGQSFHFQTKIIEYESSYIV